MILLASEQLIERFWRFFRRGILYSKSPEIVEMLSHIQPDNVNETLRAMFVSNLNSEHAYEFVLIHSDNKHIIDYTDVLSQVISAI